MENLEDIKNELKFDSETIKYYVRENKYLHILMFNQDKEPYIQTFKISKDKKSIVLSNGIISLKNTFTIGAVNKKITSNTFVNKTMTKNIIDETEYNKICLLSNDISVYICSYSFSNEFFKDNIVEMDEMYNNLIARVSKIFNDVSGNFDYEEVRANYDEIKIILDYVEDKQNFN